MKSIYDNLIETKTIDLVKMIETLSTTQNKELVYIKVKELEQHLAEGATLISYKELFEREKYMHELMEERFSHIQSTLNLVLNSLHSSLQPKEHTEEREVVAGFKDIPPDFIHEVMEVSPQIEEKVGETLPQNIPLNSNLSIPRIVPGFTFSTEEETAAVKVKKEKKSRAIEVKKTLSTSKECLEKRAEIKKGSKEDIKNFLNFADCYFSGLLKEAEKEGSALFLWTQGFISNRQVFANKLREFTKKPQTPNAVQEEEGKKNVDLKKYSIEVDGMLYTFSYEKYNKAAFDISQVGKQVGVISNIYYEKLCKRILETYFIKIGVNNMWLEPVINEINKTKEIYWSNYPKK